MAHAPDLQRLKELCLAAGPPGAEDEVRRLVHRDLEPLGSISHDRLGSLLCERQGPAKGPRVALDAHLDEVAFMVQSITSEGLIKVVPLGGWWGHVLPGQTVEILTENGKVPAVIAAKPPHFLTEAERKEVQALDQLLFDVGASTRNDVQALGVEVGDPIVPRSSFVPLGPKGRYACKAFDNRAGVGLMIETMLALKDLKPPNTVIGIGAVQEEVGCRGGGTASTAAHPDVAIVLECSPADDLPGESERQAVLGKGPQIRLFDPTAIANRRLAKLARKTAEDLGIDVQIAVRRTGGTDASTIHRLGTGIPCVVIAVPARYIHTHHSILDWNDYCAASRLVLELVLRLDADAVKQVTRYD